MANLFKDFKSNFLNLIILLIVVSLIYIIIKNLNTDNYQVSVEKVENIEDQIGTSANGYSIQSIQSQKYLTHSTDDSKNPLYFDAVELKTTNYKSRNYDMCKFVFEPVPNEPGSYFIKSSGPVDPKIGDTYVSSDSQYGLKNPRPNISSSAEAMNNPKVTTQFEIKTTGNNNNVFLINSQQYKIKPYIPDTINSINEYNLKYSFERHNNVENNRCVNENNKLYGEDSTSTTISDCAKKCDNDTQCNSFQYYYKKNENAGANTDGVCYTYKKCSGEALTDGGTDSIIYNKSDIRAKLEAERENRYRILGVKNKNFESLKKLIQDNKTHASDIIKKIQDINNLKQYPEGHSQKTINEHKEILDLIEDPSRIKEIKYKIEQDIQDIKICGLEKQISELEELRDSTSNENNVLSNSNKIHGIQSYDNSQILNVHAGKKSGDNEPDNYMIFGNGKCLSYNQTQNEDNMINQYAFTHCNVQNDQQQFNINKITDKGLYNNNVHSELNNISGDLGQPFNIINPANFHSKASIKDTKQCLTLNENGLTVEPCSLIPSQRFSTLNSITSC